MKLKVFVCTLLLCFFYKNSCAQELILEDYTPVDSLINMDYNTLSKYFSRTFPGYQVEPDSLFAHKVAMTYLWKASQTHDTLNMGKAYSLLGLLEDYRLDYLDKAIVYTKDYDDKTQPALAYSLKFINYYYRGKNKEANDMLLRAMKYCKERNNLKLLYELEYNLNTLNAQWGDKQLSIKHMVKYLSFIHSSEYDSLFSKNSKKKNEQEYVDLQYNLANTYYEENSFNLANIYLDSVYSYGVKHDVYENEYLGLKGAILYREGNFQEALKYTDKFLALEDPDDIYAMSRSSIIKGLTLWKLNRKEEAVISIKKADSLFQISDDEFEELGEGYQLLLNYYKEIDDIENQLLYLNKLIEFDRKISSNYIEIGNRIAQEHTVPQLLAKKDQVISKINAEKTVEERKKYITFILLGISGLVILYFTQAHYRNKKKFALLLEKFKKQQLPINNIETSILKDKVVLDLDKTQVVFIATGLEQFEESQGFLDSTITLKSLAKSIKTNSAYLSKYINTIKETNFSTYISDLRIHYAIYKLHGNPKFKSYTIEAIASEVGFSNTRSFTNHFKRVTGITVSYFIKRIS